MFKPGLAPPTLALAEAWTASSSVQPHTLSAEATLLPLFPSVAIVLGACGKFTVGPPDHQTSLLQFLAPVDVPVTLEETLQV